MKPSKRFRKAASPPTVRLPPWPENRRWPGAVGNALHKNPDPDHIPCYRVVNSKGELSGAFAFGGSNEQANRLRADGIEVTGNKVDLPEIRYIAVKLFSSQPFVHDTGSRQISSVLADFLPCQQGHTAV